MKDFYQQIKRSLEKNGIGREKEIKEVFHLSKAIKLKGIDFFKPGTNGNTIREKEGLVLIGEMMDGRPATMCIPWDTVIEVKAVFPWVTISKK